jgi:hypothetical protein
MNQKVKLQISTDIEDVTRVSSVLVEEALLHVGDLTSLLTSAKGLLAELNIANQEHVSKLKLVLQILNSTRIPMNKVDNRLADVVAVVDGLDKVLTQPPSEIQEQQKVEENDIVSAG